MSNQLLDAAKGVVAMAKKHGATQARASVSRRRESRVEWRDGKLDRLRESTQMSASVSLYVDGRYSSNSTSDLRPEALDRFIAESVAMTRVLSVDEHRKLADPSRYEGGFTGDLALFDEAGLSSVTPDWRRTTAAALERAVREAPGAKDILSATATVEDEDGERALVTSNGMEGTQRDTAFSLSAQATVRGEGDKKPAGWWWTSTRKRGALAPVEQVGRLAIERALRCVGEKPTKTGVYPCVIENMVVNRLLSDLLYPLQGNALQQGKSFMKDKIGKRVTSTVLTFTDDPLLVGGLSSQTFDGEGMTARRMPVVDRGVLRTYFLDTYYASKLGKEPTTGGSSNLVVTPGRRDLDAMVKAMGKGILITGFSGGNSNSATGDFSVGVRGQWVEGGKIVRPVAEMNLAGNHLTFWNRLEEVGNDPFLYSSMRTPSLRFGAVQFSGV